MEKRTLAEKEAIVTAALNTPEGKEMFRKCMETRMAEISLHDAELLLEMGSLLPNPVRYAIEHTFEELKPSDFKNHQVCKYCMAKCLGIYKGGC